jgi:PhnB protein
MRLNPHLTFNGQCAEAFKFYEAQLGGRIEMMMRYGEAPMAENVPPELHEYILHATLAFDDQVITGGDVPPAHYEKPRGFSMLLNLDATAESERIFDALAENGAIHMRLQETFWAQRFGIVIDRYGTPWTINCGNP